MAGETKLCPVCDLTHEGEFCGTCGTRLQSMNVTCSCGEEVGAHRYCRKCGKDCRNPLVAAAKRFMEPKLWRDIAGDFFETHIFGKKGKTG